jgi:organic hydroperoxide reductase OsmC/OhrA
MAGAQTATVIWERGDDHLLNKRYSRAHVWRFDYGCEVPGSCPPSKLIPVPLAKPDAVDPGEGHLASLSACHMLFFLAFAAKDGYRVDFYVDEAEGVLGKNERGRLFMERITLRPDVTFSGETIPAADAIDQLHHEAHEQCFIANSLRSEIVFDPPPLKFV